MRRFKKWIASKGGIATISVSIALVIIALVFITIGYVYLYLDGEWARVGEVFTSKTAITLYIIAGLIAFGLINLLFIALQHREY